MPIERSQSDAYIQERAKWEQRDVYSDGTFIRAIPKSEGGRKDDGTREEFPKMLYRAETFPGGPRISDTHIVRSEAEELIARGQGWHVRQEDAIAAVGDRDLELARLAANRAHNEKWMSGKAKEEAAAIDESTMQHVAAIPETPLPPKRTKVELTK